MSAHQSHISRPQVQAKMRVNAPDDVFEREADQMADRIIRQPAMETPMHSFQAFTQVPVSRKCAACEAEESDIQREEDPDSSEDEIIQSKSATGGFEVNQGFESRLLSRKGAGAPMEEGLRNQMEQGFGANFGGVRIHTGSEAAVLSRQINAKAFTHGNDVFFGQGQYQPQSEVGKRLLAHELTHTIQQGASGVSRQIQRSALASWEPVTDSDRYETLKHQHSGKKDKTVKNFDKQEAVRQQIDTLNKKSSLDKKETKKLNKLKKKLAKWNSKGKIIGLPTIDGMMSIKANYHYMAEYATGDPANPIKVEKKVLDAVKDKYRCGPGSSVNFWPDIYWEDQHGNAKTIGVRFHIDFKKHNPPAKGKDMGRSKEGHDFNLMFDPTVQNNPWENYYGEYPIDALTNMDDVQLENFVTQNSLKGFTFQRPQSAAWYIEYTEGGNTTKFDAMQLFFAKEKVREVYRKANLKNPAIPIENDTLGLGNREEVGVDPDKTAPAQWEHEKFGKYSLDSDHKDYYKPVEDKFKQKTTSTFSAEEQRNRLAGVIAHEIGHNIGLMHSDAGLMSESTEANRLEKASEVSWRNPDHIDIGSGTSSYSNPMDDPSVRYAFEYKMELKGSDLTRENVQLLVNRIRKMTTEMPQTRDASGYLQDKDQFWTQELTDLETEIGIALKDPNLTGNLFNAGNEFLLQLLQIPHDMTGLSNSGNKQTWDSLGDKRANDFAIIDRIVKNNFQIRLSDWNQLTVGTKTFILQDSLRVHQGKGRGSGLTYFEDAKTMNQI